MCSQKWILSKQSLVTQSTAALSSELAYEKVTHFCFKTFQLQLLRKGLFYHLNTILRSVSKETTVLLNNTTKNIKTLFNLLNFL